MHHLEFKAKGSDEYVGLNCTESIDNVVAFKMHIVPSFPTEIDLGNIFAIFGDSYLSRTEILLNCGFNTSVGCPGNLHDQQLIGGKPGVHDTVLPRSMFKQTHRRKVQVPL